MADPAAALTSLLRATSIEDHDEVLRAANAAIKASKGNLQAHHTRVVALLNLDRWDDALRALAEGGDRLEEECLLEKAYAFYKLGQLEDAENLLKSTSEPSRALQHLGAQVAYRLEKFQEAADTYRHLSQEGNGRSGEENDLRINTLATHTQLEWNGLGGLLAEKERQPSREDLEAFESAYNAACRCIAQGDFSRASVLLKRSRDLCGASEELSPEQKREELMPILIQHAYVLTRLGKEVEAIALQRSVVLSEIPDAQTKAVARNNETAVGVEDRNPFLTQRLTQSAAADLTDSDKFFEYQASIFRRNRYALDLKIQKFNGVESSTSKLILTAPTPTASREIAELGVISAAARAHLETGKAALKEILPMLEKRPSDVGLLLTIIQLYVQTQNPGPALTLLETFLRRLETATTPDHQDVRFAPGLVAVAVALYRLQGRQNAVRTELARASTHWRSKPAKESAMSLLREAGVDLLKSSNPRHHAIAGATFENLVATSSRAGGSGDDDATVTAGLVASFATADYAKIEPYLSGLAPVDRLTAGVDVQALIDAGVASVPTITTTTTATTTTAAATGKKRPADGGEPGGNSSKRRRNNKPRLPKDYVEGSKPDPERWLPLRDRSTYRPKGRKGKRRAQEATQGGVVRGAAAAAEEETLELVGGAGAVKVEKATPGGAGGGGGGGASGGGGGGGGGGKKGKKKGKR